VLVLTLAVGIGTTVVLSLLVRAGLAIKTNSLAAKWTMLGIWRSSSSLSTVWSLSLILLISSHEMVSKLTRHVHHLVNINVGLSILHVFIDNSDDGPGSLFWVGDLQEGVLMALSVFTSGTVVKIFADATLVPDSKNWSFAAAITLDSLMDNLVLVFGDTGRRNLALSRRLWVVVEIVEDLATLLVKLLLDHFLEGFPWNAWLLLGFGFLDLGSLLFHLFVDLDLLFGVRGFRACRLDKIVFDGVLDSSLNVIAADWNLLLLDLLFLGDLGLDNLERVLGHDRVLGLLSGLHQKLDLVVH